MKKILTIIATTVLGTTSIANSNLITQIHLNKKSNSKTISNNVKDNSNPFIKNVISNLKFVGLATAPNGTIYAQGEKCLYYSTDNGKTFKEINNNIEANNIAVALNGTIYISSNSGLYYSTDNGKTFQEINNIQNIITSICIAPNGTIYAQGEKCLYYSNDGINFQQVLNLPNNNYVNYIAVAPNGNVYVGIGNFLYVSYDNGKNFQEINNKMQKDIFILCIFPNGIICAASSLEVYYSTDTGKTFQKNKGDWAEFGINNFFVAPNGTIYAISNSSGFAELYISTDGINFTNLNIDGDGSIGNISQLLFLPNGDFYISSYYSGIWKFNLIDNLISYNQPNYFLNNQFVYDKPTNISISDTYLQSATLDGKDITLPTTNLNLGVGKHTLTLSMKNDYKQYALVNKGTAGVITYNFWIKDTIAENHYGVNSDTTLYQGLVSNAGNTNGTNIIQTSANSGSTHLADLKISLQDKLIDLSKSYYVSGTVDTNNDFTATGSKTYLSNNQFKISTDGIYQLHLVDKVGNIQDTYLELGHDNWKLKGTFQGNWEQLRQKLNVTVNVVSPNDFENARIQGFLNQYKQHADKAIVAEATKYGAGFNITVADLAHSYKSFLDKTVYTDQGGSENINISKLDNAIKEAVQNKINSGLNSVNSLTKKYNISTTNVIDSNSLNSYVSWINNYDSWFNKNETTILTNEINKVSHGYASQSEIKNILANINISNIFNSVNYSLQTSTNYQQFINYQNLDQAILKADSSQTWEAQYQADLKIQESNLNLHGYTIAQILGNKQEPQTKSQMENYDNSGESFHSWLQTEANSKYHKYQLDTGLEIGLPLFVLVSLISLTWYYRHTKKYKLFVFKRTNVKNKEKVDD